ncbi:MAG TPA: DinB family protein [Myxococcaceae bacterium]|nr:DinB family protein [Myxococcaceae bacterium]
MTPAEVQELGNKLEETPGNIRKLISNVPDSELRWKRSPAYFSILENICHLRDIELEGYTVRLQKLLRETKPLLADIKGDQLAIERKYNEQPLEPALAAFASGRLANVRLIRGLSEEQLRRTGTLETVGQITLEKLLQMILEHDEDHLEQMAEAKNRSARA